MRTPATHLMTTALLITSVAFLSIHCDLFNEGEEKQETGDPQTHETGDPSNDTGQGSDTSIEDTGFTSCDPFTPDVVAGPDCLSGTLFCGDTISGTTVGGSDQLDETLYERNYCFVPYESYGGAERVYAFDLQSDGVATFTLDSPCSDLDLIVFRWEETDRCPTEDHMTAECEADTSRGGGKVADLWNNSSARYLIIVDGKDEAEDNFTLSVSCGSR